MTSDVRVEVVSREALQTWLAANRDRREGVWLVTFKKGDPHGRYLPYRHIVEELLTQGWVDINSRPT